MATYGKTRKTRLPHTGDQNRVIPANAGIQTAQKSGHQQRSWIPARAALGRNDVEESDNQRAEQGE